jgi:integrase
VLSRASVAPNVRLAASGEGEGGSFCFFLTCILREEDLAVHANDTGIVGPLCRLTRASALYTATGCTNHQNGAQKLIERLGVAAKMPFPIHAHMLRHAAGYALAARGIDTRTLQAFMGHRSIANTVVYTAVADKRIRNIWGK